MSRSDRVSRFVDAILHDRRPPRFDATPEEAEMLRAAAGMRAARSGADLPRAEFVSALEDRLRTAADQPVVPMQRRRLDRRAFLRGAGVAAAAAAVGVGVDRGIQASLGTSTAQARLVPSGATWQAVATLADVRRSGALRFTAGAVEGYVVARGDAVEAISAICTHMGCVLGFNSTDRRLDCPCHGASFDLGGTPLNREYITPLPALQARITGDDVEVLA